MEILVPFGKLRCGFCHTYWFCGSYQTRFAFRLAAPIPDSLSPHSPEHARNRLQVAVIGRTQLAVRSSQGSLDGAGLSVATVMWGQLLPRKFNSTRCVYCICANSAPCSSLTCSIQKVVVTSGAAALGPPVGGSPFPVRKAILAVPPPTSGTEPTRLFDVSLKTVVLRTVCLTRASDKKRFGFVR